MALHEVLSFWGVIRPFVPLCSVIIWHRFDSYVNLCFFLPLLFSIYHVSAKIAELSFPIWCPVSLYRSLSKWNFFLEENAWNVWLAILAIYWIQTPTISKDSTSEHYKHICSLSDTIDPNWLFVEYIINVKTSFKLIMKKILG